MTLSGCARRARRRGGACGRRARVGVGGGARGPGTAREERRAWDGGGRARARAGLRGETGDARGGDVARAVVGGIVVERRRGGRARRRLGRMLGSQRGVGRGRGGGRLARRRGADPPGARGGIVAHLEPLQSRDDVLRGRHRAGAARDWAGGGRTIRRFARVPITAGPRETAFPRCARIPPVLSAASRTPRRASTTGERPDAPRTIPSDRLETRARASPSHPPGRPTLASRDPLPRTSIGRHVGLQVPEARARARTSREGGPLVEDQAVTPTVSPQKTPGDRVREHRLRRPRRQGALGRLPAVPPNCRNRHPRRSVPRAERPPPRIRFRTRA